MNYQIENLKGFTLSEWCEGWQYFNNAKAQKHKGYDFAKYYVKWYLHEAYACAVLQIYHQMRWLIQ